MISGKTALNQTQLRLSKQKINLKEQLFQKKISDIKNIHTFAVPK